MTAPAWTTYRDAGLAKRSRLTVLRSTAPFRNATLRSCILRSESGSMAGVSVRPVGGTVLSSVAAPAITVGGATCSLVLVVANKAQPDRRGPFLQREAFD